MPRKPISKMRAQIKMLRDAGLKSRAKALKALRFHRATVVGLGAFVLLPHGGKFDILMRGVVLIGPLIELLLARSIELRTSCNALVAPIQRLEGLLAKTDRELNTSRSRKHLRGCKAAIDRRIQELGECPPPSSCPGSSRSGAARTVGVFARSRQCSPGRATRRLANRCVPSCIPATSCTRSP